MIHNSILGRLPGSPGSVWNAVVLTWEQESPRLAITVSGCVRLWVGFRIFTV